MTNIITIHGLNGAGKSTAAKNVAERLKYNHFSTGDFARQIAASKKIDIKQLMATERKPGPGSIDKVIDDKLIEIIQRPPVVIDSRMGYYFAPQSYRVYLTLDWTIAAERIFADKKRSESQKFKTVAEVEQYLRDRHDADKIAYEQRYKTDFSDPNNFDLIIDTGKDSNNPRVVVETIISNVSNFNFASLQ